MRSILKFQIIKHPNQNHPLSINIYRFQKSFLIKVLQYLNCPKMNQANSTVPTNAKLKFTFKDSVVHHFQNKKKEKVAEGSCMIYETDSSNETPTAERTYYVSVKNFIDEISSTKLFVRINYPENTSYLFEKQNWTICSISFNKNKGYEEFDKLFSEFAVILDFNSENIDDKLKGKISEHCPDNIQTKDISSDFMSIWKKVGKNIGLIAGKASNIFSRPAAEAASSISERASKISRESISQETKTKWANVKQKSNHINQSLTQMMRPLLNKYRSFEDKIAESFSASQNKVVKTVRQYGLAFSQSVNEAQKSTYQQQAPGTLKEDPSQCQFK